MAQKGFEHDRIFWWFLFCNEIKLSCKTINFFLALPLSSGKRSNIFSHVCIVFALVKSPENAISPTAFLHHFPTSFQRLRPQ